MESKDNVEDNDQFQISEKMIREEALAWINMLRRLSRLQHYYLYRHNDSTVRQKDILNHLRQALDNISFANKPHKGRAIRSCTTEEELDCKKLNYMMLHGRRNLAEEKQLFRNKNMCHKTDDASSSSLQEIMKNVQMKYSYYNRLYKQNNCHKLLKEIKHFEVTRKKSAQLKQSIRNQEKIMNDELIEMGKKRHALETKIKHVDREIDLIYEELKPFHKDYKEANCQKDASLFMLQMKRREYRVLKCSNLEYDFIRFHDIYLEKPLSQERRRRNKQT
ncbi:hypothetical protein AAZX31_01G090400 [Glycine max]|uniref:Uncharacterized protein n=3 Tax=Glycine subgen. Soja TaxID=1462606 RepID=K7K2X0_SOYBN|nr:uncharacterized protein LOC102669590 [Glycine max]XP_028234977.1 uncharacterized protein LOC114414771 isoform X1 [Glycine soja]KAH1162413.1 hypothetical protein GYH30_001059 [Glycine max]KRH75641.1 hypothetical protein GLYMA_01G098300v4 [Glycine max]RZC29278.1 hypothetical protein D0Y65_001020 [Glycine soja]|eukprot:XP_006573304.1 uncharacterized protein LOC102669590 [Glycine max]